jgi:hypothetical protein
LFSESYADMVTTDAVKTKTGYTAPVNEYMDQAVTYIKNNHSKDDPAIRHMRVDLGDFLTLSKSPEEQKLNTIIGKNDDFNRFFDLYTDFIINTGKMLQKENWVNEHFFKLQPDLSPGIEAYEGRNFDGQTDEERLRRRPSVDG